MCLVLRQQQLLPYQDVQLPCGGRLGELQLDRLHLAEKLLLLDDGVQGVPGPLPAKTKISRSVMFGKYKKDKEIKKIENKPVKFLF